MPSRAWMSTNCARRFAVNAQVADNPEQGFHFHTGRRLARILGYSPEWLEHVPEETIASIAAREIRFWRAG